MARATERGEATTESTWSRGSVNSTATTTRNETALSPKDRLTRPAAIIAPPMAGPTARATLKAPLFSVMACGSRDRGTRSGTMVWNAGMATALPEPSASVSSRIPSTPSRSPAASTAIVPTAAEPMRLPTISSVRRSTTSASAPAGRVSSSRGSSRNAVTRLTRNAEPVSSSMSHGAAVICRKVPRWLTTAASHIRR